MWNKIKEFFRANNPSWNEGVSTQSPSSPTTNKPKTPRKKVELSAKEKATAAGEPYVSIIKVDIDPNNVNNGAFELDWNDKFVLNLIRAGYKIREDDTDAQIVDRWFQTVCRNIALEVYEQEAADPVKRNDIRIVQNKDIGNGRTEVS